MSACIVSPVSGSSSDTVGIACFLTFCASKHLLPDAACSCCGGSVKLANILLSIFSI